MEMDSILQNIGVGLKPKDIDVERLYKATAYARRVHLEREKEFGDALDSFLNNPLVKLRIVGNGRAYLKLGKRIEQLRKSSQDKHRKMVHIVEEVFGKVFKNMHYKTIILVDGDRPLITVGRHGFGIRWNVQSSRVERISDIRLLLKKQKDIISALEKYDLSVWKEKFELFCEMVDGIPLDDYYRQAHIGDVKFDEPFKMYDSSESEGHRTVEVHEIELSAALIQTDNRMRVWMSAFDGENNREFVPRSEHYLLYVFGDLFIKKAQEYCDETRGVYAQADKKVSELKDTFAKELLVSAL